MNLLHTLFQNQKYPHAAAHNNQFETFWRYLTEKLCAQKINIFAKNSFKKSGETVDIWRKSVILIKSA